jgi:hypothetical protein
VPYSEKEEAKETAQTRWDPESRTWFIGEGHARNMDVINQWLLPRKASRKRQLETVIAPTPTAAEVRAENKKRRKANQSVCHSGFTQDDGVVDLTGDF